MRQTPIILNEGGRLSRLPSGQKLEGVVYCENRTFENHHKIFRDNKETICLDKKLFIKIVVLKKVFTSALRFEIPIDTYFKIAKNNTLEVINGIR